MDEKEHWEADINDGFLGACRAVNRYKYVLFLIISESFTVLSWPWYSVPTLFK